MAGGNLLKILSNNKAKCYTKRVQLRKCANAANKRQSRGAACIRREIRFLTQLLIRAFVKDYKNRQDPQVRERYGRMAGIVGVCCNLLLFAGKLMVGTLFGSIAITADAINNLSDASSNIVSLIGFKLAAKAPDAEHPYGHARYEYVAGLAVSTMIMAIGLSLLKESAGKVLHPEEVGFSLLTVGVLCASILVKLWMSFFNRRVGLIIESETLIATAADSRNDVISTSAVLVSSVLCKITHLNIIDGIMGLGVAVFILWSGWGLVRDTLSPLLGESPSPELVEKLEKKVLSYPRVLGVHDMMVHDYGPGRQFASLHVEFPTEVYTEPMPGRTDMVAYMEGPLVLAGLTDGEVTLETDNLARPQDLLVPEYGQEYKTIRWTQSHYRTTGQSRNIRLVPLYEIGDESYEIYFPLRKRANGR